MIKMIWKTAVFLYWMGVLGFCIVLASLFIVKIKNIALYLNLFDEKDNFSYEDMKNLVIIL